MRIYSNSNFAPTITHPNIDSTVNGAPILNYGFNSIKHPDINFDAIQLPPAVPGSVVIGFFMDAPFPPNFQVTVYANQEAGDNINGTGTSIAWDFPTGMALGFPEIQPLLICICVFQGVWFVNILED